MSKRILIVGDAPSEATGLGRIARDLAGLLHEAGWKFSQLGLNHDERTAWPWPVLPLKDHANWGFHDLPEALERTDPEIVFTIWDPSRCFGLLHSPEGDPINWGILQKYGAKLWGYFPVDAEDPFGGFIGPPAEALRYYDRILAYGKYGQGVISNALKRLSPSYPELNLPSIPPVEWLPHGLSDIWKPLTEDECKAARAIRTKEWKIPEDAILIGCVASNQIRKDLGLVFAVWAQLVQEVQLHRRGTPREGRRGPYYFWLHTDRLENAWSISQLAMMYNLQDQLRVTLRLTDLELREWYGCCALTLAPGLGEGFGYPIIESQAVGIPVIHGNYGGGAEWTPCLVEPRTWRIEGLYGLLRPVFDPKDWIKATGAALASGSLTDVSALQWKPLWPEWLRWFEGNSGRKE